MRVASSLLAMIVHRTSKYRHPGQIALAMTVGVLLGLLPTISVPFCLLAIGVCFIRLHLPILVLTALVINLAAPMISPTLGWIGLYSLTHPTLANAWLRLDRLPLVPWLSLHNSVVHGCVAVWLMGALPMFATLRTCLRWLMPEGEVLELLSVTGVETEATQEDSDAVVFQELRPYIGKAEAGIDQQITPEVILSTQAETAETSVAPTQESTFAQPHYRFETNPALESGTYVQPDMSSDPDNDNQYLSLPSGRDPAASSRAVIERASDLAAWADDAITALLRQETVASSSSAAVTDTQVFTTAEPRPADDSSTQLSHPARAENMDDDERWLIETTMEVVRIAEHTVSQQATNKSKATAGNSMASTVNESTRHEDQIVRREQSTQSDLRVHSMPAIINGDDQPREEALQYLLRHLKGIQEKVKKL